MLVLTLVLTSCTSLKTIPLQIVGAESTAGWEPIGLECQATQDCIDQSLQQGASLEDVEGRTRCNQNECEWKIERNLEIAELE